VLAQDTLGVWATNSCTGYDDDLSGLFSGWDTDNHAVAMMSSRRITGMGAGSTNAFASGTFNYNNGVSKYCSPRQATPHTPTTVNPCPTSLSVDQIFPKSLPDYDHPTWLTGVGALARMKAGPTGTDYTGAALIETVTPTYNNCPSNIAQYTSFPTIRAGDTPAFIVGSSAFWEDTSYQSVSNDFYDSHKNLVNINVLGLTDVSSCVARATQTYSCNGSLVGTFTLTNTYTKGTLNGTAVTNVSTTKQ
jgi:hypothetical protein